jgi:acyl dehydratase
LRTTVANLGMTDVNFPAPVFHGDSIHVVTTVEDTRPSGSRPKAGIVTFRHRAFNQTGTEVANCVRTALMHRRPASHVSSK